MFSNRTLLLGLAVGLSTFLSLPTAQASELGSIFQETLKSDYSYEAAITATVDGDIMGEEVPFDVFLDVNSRGTKDGFDFSNTTAVQAKMTNFSSEISDEVGGLSMVSVWGTLENWFFEKGQTSYSKLNGFNLRSDNEKVDKIMMMVQEMVKAVTGRTYRFSVEDLMKSVMEIVPEAQQTAEIDQLMSVFNGSLGIQKQMQIGITFYDQMIDAGLFKVEMGRSGASSPHFIHGPTTSYKLSLASELSEDQVQMLIYTVAELYNSIVPGLGDQLIEDMTTGSTSEDTRMVNDFLRLAARAGFEMEFIVAQNRILAVNADLDLHSAGIPVVATVRKTMNYGPQKQMVEPSEENVVNVNAIVDGLLTIGAMTQQAFETSFDQEFPEYDVETYDYGQNWNEEDATSWDEETSFEEAETSVAAERGMSPRMLQMRKQAAVERIMDRVALVCDNARCARAVASKTVRQWRDQYGISEMQEILLAAFDRISSEFQE